MVATPGPLLTSLPTAKNFRPRGRSEKTQMETLSLLAGPPTIKQARADGSRDRPMQPEFGTRSMIFNSALASTPSLLVLPQMPPETYWWPDKLPMQRGPVGLFVACKTRNAFDWTGLR